MQDIYRVPIVTEASVGLLKESDDADVRRHAAKKLGEIGAMAETAILDLAEATHDEDKIVRWYAARALGRLGRPAVPALIQALQHEDTTLRRKAADALGDIGPEARTAVSALARTLQDDEDTNVRWTAARALLEIGADAKAAIPAVKKAAFYDKDQDVRSLAFSVLVSLRSIELDERIRFQGLPKPPHD